jgi:pimeloyl-ACP methyl ester carboxylesterase
MTEFLDIKGGRIAYEVTGEGPLIVLSHGMGDWKSISRTDVAGDLVALIRHLDDGPAVIVGHSLSGGAATIAAATAPDLVSGIVEIGPFTRKVQYSLGGLLRVGRYRRGSLLLGGVMVLRSLRMAEFLKTMKTSPADAGAAGIVAEMPAGLGAVAMIRGAGHYPHAQCAVEVAGLTATFVRDRVLA